MKLITIDKDNNIVFHENEWMAGLIKEMRKSCYDERDPKYDDWKMELGMMVCDSELDLVDEQ